MAVRRIINMGHPNLRQVAKPVPEAMLASEEITRLIADMQDTLRDYGGIGLAAPQIDVPLRLAIVEIPGGPTRYGQLAPMPLTTFINPSIEVLDDRCAGFWEGCLSVPGLRGFVTRPQHVRVRYTDIEGQPVSLEQKGFPATVFQHEFDHLDGRLFIDRMDDMSQLMFEAEFDKYGPIGD